jgi:hypothetical protein
VTLEADADSAAPQARPTPEAYLCISMAGQPLGFRRIMTSRRTVSGCAWRRTRDPLMPWRRLRAASSRLAVPVLIPAVPDQDASGILTPCGSGRFVSSDRQLGDPGRNRCRRPSGRSVPSRATICTSSTRPRNPSMKAFVRPPLRRPAAQNSVGVMFFRLWHAAGRHRRGPSCPPAWGNVDRRECHRKSAGRAGT